MLALSSTSYPTHVQSDQQSLHEHVHAQESDKTYVHMNIRINGGVSY
jgi:hypothetical protein